MAQSAAHDRGPSPSRRRFLAKVLGGTALAAAGLGTYVVFVERHWVAVTRRTVRLAGLPAAFRGTRIAHLTDLHHGPLMSLDAIGKILDLTMSLAPDLVVLTGDYVLGSGRRSGLDAVMPLLGRLRAPLGVFAVLGNHDHWADGSAAAEWLDRLGISLVHRRVPLEKDGQRIWLSGTGDLWEDTVSIDEDQAGIPEDEIRINLCHNPDGCDVAWRSRVDLMLAGHTHGGQVVIPGIGAPVLPVENKRYSSGLIQTEKTRLFISRGLGWAVYPVRFNCRPEIPVLTLDGE